MSVKARVLVGLEILPYLDRAEEALARLDGLLLAVGRDLEPERFSGRPHPSSTLHSPLRDETELALARAAIPLAVPVLGVCRGMQVINVALGDSLHPDHSVLPAPARQHLGGDWVRWEKVVRARLAGTPPPPHPSHEVEIAPGSQLVRALGRHATVNSYHHQSIARLGDELTVTARAPDGVIEAIEVPGARTFCIGVQWELQEQPESPLFALLVHAAGQRAMLVAETQDGSPEPRGIPA